MTRTPALALLAASAVALTACGQSVAPVAKADHVAAPVTLTNCGTETAFPAPQRVVALNLGQAGLVARLGEAKKVVGVAQTKGSPLPADLTAGGHQVPVLSVEAPPTREQLLSAKPDLVLSPTTYEFTAEKGYATQEQLKQAGAQTYVAAAGCFGRRSKAEVTDVLTDVDALGRILRAEPKAAELRKQGEQQLKQAADRAQGKTPVSLAQLFIEGDTVTAIGAGVEHSIAKAAGAAPVFTPDDPAFAKFFAAEVSRETLLAKNPGAIVIATTSDSHEQRSRAWLAQHLGQTDAVKNNRIIVIPATEVLPGTWGNLDAVTTINRALYAG
ncbi:ABC transporter substrate-binding protein [Mariniluteicoccus flavus]